MKRVLVHSERNVILVRPSSHTQSMNQQRFVKLAALAFGLILVSFVILGFSRLVLPFETARMLAAPTTFAAFLLVVYLLVRGVLSALGVAKIREE
ncbi:hypothetical protein [Haladaptatus sp. CMSO5]|uniref:hypothetical protein n=1 Tax=Haladaptatus sp. CMSO5 TaxID=3120514 RepID=UPI002FCE0A5E